VSPDNISVEGPVVVEMLEAGQFQESQDAARFEVCHTYYFALVAFNIKTTDKVFAGILRHRHPSPLVAD
jgi:hypothetical protein